LGIESNSTPFFGVDIWNAYELSWLNHKGKPQIGIATFIVPAHSPNIIESKSWKLYLNSLNNHSFNSEEALIKTLSTDLTATAGAFVSVKIARPEMVAAAGMKELQGKLLDRLDIEINPNEQPNQRY